MTSSRRTASTTPPPAKPTTVSTARLAAAQSAGPDLPASPSLAAGTGPSTGTTYLGQLGGWSAVLGGVLLLAVFVVTLPPDPANSLKPLWGPTQSGHCVAFLWMTLGLPAIASSFGPRLRWYGVIGYVALQTQLVFSFGSHVYLMWVVPILERHRAALGSLIAGENSPLHKYYTTHDSAVGLLGLGMTGLAVTLWRCGPGMRAIATLYTVALVGELLQLGPLGLAPLAVVVAWLGARVVARGSVLVPLRGQLSRTARQEP